MDTAETEAQGRWLGPSAALNRFKQRSISFSADSDGSDVSLSYGFTIGDVGFLVPKSVISEILDPLPVCALPDAPDWFVGLCNLRGSVIPVYQVAAFLRMRIEASEKTKLLVIGKSDSAVGILINGLPQPLKLADNHLMTELPPVPEPLLDIVPKAYLRDERVWLEFDHERLFSAIAERAYERQQV